jgi:hypothetical protein
LRLGAARRFEPGEVRRVGDGLVRSPAVRVVWPAGSARGVRISFNVLRW